MPKDAKDSRRTETSLFLLAVQLSSVRNNIKLTTWQVPVSRYSCLWQDTLLIRILILCFLSVCATEHTRYRCNNCHDETGNEQCECSASRQSRTQIWWLRFHFQFYSTVFRSPMSNLNGIYLGSGMCPRKAKGHYLIPHIALCFRGWESRIRSRALMMYFLVMVGLCSTKTCVVSSLTETAFRLSGCYDPHRIVDNQNVMYLFCSDLARDKFK